MDPLSEKIIQQLVNLADSEDEQTIKDILQTYNFKIPSSQNVEALVENFSRDDLQKVVGYINENYKESHPVTIQRLKRNQARTKAGYAFNVKCFLNDLLPVPCSTCNTEYIHTTAENSADNTVRCILCNRFSHKSCIKEEDLKPGIVHACYFCVTDLESRRKNANKETSDSGKDQLNISTISRRSSIDEDAEDEKKSQEGDSNKVEDAVKASQAGICALYSEGKCPHGLRGRNCKFEHPKKCKYYCSYGNEYPRGCRRGKKCWFFHPKLCQNSIKMKACLNTSCTFVHLAGTRRSGEPRQWNDEERRSEPYDGPGHRIERQRPTPWLQEKENYREEKTYNGSTNKTNEDFLEKYLEKMKTDLKNEQTQLSQQIQAQVAQQVQVGIQQALNTMHQQQANIVPQINHPQQVYIRQPPG